MGIQKQNHQALRLVATVGLAALFLVTILSWANSGSAAPAPAPSLGQEAGTLSNGSIITIGVAAGLSNLDWIGWRQANAVQLAVNQVNAAGGIEIGGVAHTVVLVTADSMCDPSEAITAANALLDAGAVSVVGHTCSGASHQAQSLYNAAGVAMVSPSSTMPDLTEEGYTTTFRVIGRDDTGAALLATYFHDVLGLTRAAIVEWSGLGWASAFSSTFTGLGGTITSRRTVTSTEEYTATLTAIQAENPAAIFYANYDDSAAGLLSRVAHNLGLSDVVIGQAVGSDLDTYAAAAGSAAEGDYTVVHRATNDMPGYEQFNADYQAAGFPNHGEEADMWGAFAYDAAQIILAAIDRADVTDTLAVRDEIATMAGHEGVVGFYEGFDAQGDVVPQWMQMKLYQDGQWVRVRTTPITTWYVYPDGSDSNTGRTTDSPFATVQHAINVADDGDTIIVAAGTYTENLSVHRRLTLRGGYTISSTVTGTVWLPPATGTSIVDGSGNPTVIGDWDGHRVWKPAVISDGVEYKMWFDGTDLLSEVGVGLATSSDGVSWTKHLANPVLTGTINAWDASGEEHAPFVLKEGGVYKMWYEGSNDDVRQLGYATSTNGIDWHKHANNPVLEAGPEGYDQGAVAHGSVLNDGGTYKLWYHAAGDQGAIIAYATSPDGVNWTKQGPVLLPEPGSWDEGAVWGPSVLKLNGTYWMWYSAASSHQPPAIGVVTSTNGVTWTRFLAGPIMTETTALGDPHVISDGGKLKMWYQDFEQGVVNYAESDDGISWATSPNNPVLTPGTPGRWGGPVVRFKDGSDGSVLDGFTITGGSDDYAGGVDASNASLTIRNCVIRDNFANGMPNHFGGGGVLGGGNGKRLTIANSHVVSNRVNGGAGGVRVYEGTAAMTNTLVADNRGEAGVHVNGPLALMNTTVANNDGGVIFNPPSSATLTLVNGIVYGNGWSVGVPDQPGAWAIQVSHSDVEGGWSGAGNIDADPQFVDPTNGDYHLQGNSPAIDAGTPAGAPPADLDGTPRDVDPDMGAYEYQRFDHDAAVVDVLPSGAVAVNVAFPIRATLYNVGTLTENGVPVTCEIEHDSATVYSETTNSGPIPPLTWEVLEFPTYTPTEEGAYVLVCRSALGGDGNPSNDVYTRTLNAVAEIADVWTKDNPDDDGDVPSGLNNWYMSPDLWVRNNDDGGLIHQDPIANITNTVYVRLRNRGTVAISGTVDVYWIEPSLGVRCGDWAYIGTITFTRLLPGEVRILSLPWVPTRTGHTCLQDVIDSPQDPYNRALECAPQWVPWDNNVEWRNVNIIPNPPAGPLGAQGTQDVQQAEVRLVNVYNLPQEVDVIIERMTFPITGTITVQLPPELFDRWTAYSGRWSDGIEVLTATREISITGAVSATIGAVPMRAAEKAKVGLRFDGPAGLEFEIAIRERIGGVTMGGMAYQWTIPDTTPPDVVSTSPAAGDVEVALDAPIIITFSEQIGPLSLNLALTPTLDVTTTWNEAGTVVTATHAIFAQGTTYTATVTAKDAAGNPLGVPARWSFTTLTEGSRIYLPLVLRSS